MTACRDVVVHHLAFRPFMKVIHFVAAIDRSLGGVSIYMQMLAKELGKFVDLLIVTRQTVSPLHLENCQVRFLPLSMGKIVMFRNEWVKILENEQPDIVHINGIWMIQTWIAQREALRMGIKTLITPHGMLEPWIIRRHYLSRKLPALWLYQKKAVKAADCLHATAESEKEHLVALGYNVNIVVIPNGIDTGGVALKSSWQRRREILFMSRVHVKKGIETLIEAVALMRNELRGYVITIAGEGDRRYIEMLKDKICRLGLGDMFRFVGGVYGNGKWQLLKNADVLVLPTFSENFGIVVAEALACGTPVITTKGAPWHDLETWGCGWWIERDVESLANALKEFLTLDENTLERMGRNGRRLVEEKYSSRRMAEDMFRVYAGLLG